MRYTRSRNFTNTFYSNRTFMQHSQTPPQLGTPSILVAEDNPDLRAWLQEVLQSEGYAVKPAVNGRRAMDLLRQDRVDLMITDLAMPEQEGIETIQMVRKEYPALKIVVISGAFGDEVLRIAKKFGAAAALRKPVQIETLLETVHQVLAQ